MIMEVGSITFENSFSDAAKKNISRKRLFGIADLAVNERELPVELREAVGMATDAELDLMIESSADLLSVVLGERRKRLEDRNGN